MCDEGDIEEVRTIHEKDTKWPERRLLFSVRSCDFVDRAKSFLAVAC